MSPTKLLTITTLTGVATATKILCAIFETSTHATLVPRNISVLLTLLVSLSWLGLMTCCLANHLDKRTAETKAGIEAATAAIIEWIEAKVDETAGAAVERIEKRIDDAVDEAGDRRSIAAVVTAVNEMQKWGTRDPRRPHLVEN